MSLASLHSHFEGEKLHHYQVLTSSLVTLPEITFVVEPAVVGHPFTMEVTCIEREEAAEPSFRVT